MHVKTYFIQKITEGKGTIYIEVIRQGNKYWLDKNKYSNEYSKYSNEWANNF